MTEAIKKFLHATMPSLPLASKGELVVLPPASQSLVDLTAYITKGHDEVEKALLSAVSKAIEIGKALAAAKKQVGHGHFEPYVTFECHISMSTAQNYMRLSKYEPHVRQLLEAKNTGRGYLTMTEALRLIDKLRAERKKPKPKAKA